MCRNCFAVWVNALALLAVGLCGGSGRADDGAAIRTRALNGYLSLIESIDTLEARCESSREDLGPGQTKRAVFMYYRRSDVERTTTLDTQGRPTGWTVGAGGVSRTVALTDGKPAWASVSPHGTVQFAHENPWSLWGFRPFMNVIHPLRQRKLDVRNLGGTATAVPGPKGRESVRVRSESPTGWKENDYAAAYNWLCVRRVWHFTALGAKGTTETTECSDVKEATPGIYLPHRVDVTGVDVATGKTMSRVSLRITELKVNRPLADELFVVKLPAGVDVTDQVRKRKYQVDENGTVIEATVRPLR